MMTVGGGDTRRTCGGGGGGGENDVCLAERRQDRGAFVSRGAAFAPGGLADLLQPTGAVSLAIVKNPQTCKRCSKSSFHGDKSNSTD